MSLFIRSMSYFSPFDLKTVNALIFSRNMKCHCFLFEFLALVYCYDET